ncbi:bifunctional methyltransferase/pyrophosphohydrolase YabN [Candidatus Solincola sp.]|nr:nucleoside triphosphate pyrophosphohydrolase [Actinomycetota bacterium]MDI7251004.1 nucleoside triphosphate pyrophosphohydrolase [Actinomycetota bacterium]
MDPRGERGSHEDSSRREWGAVTGERPVVHVVGLGPGPLSLLTVEAWEELRSADEVLLRTEKHPCVAELRERGIVLRPLDYWYEGSKDLEEAYRGIVGEVVRRAEERRTAWYAVPGHPLVAERTVKMLLQEPVEVRLHNAVSFFDAVLSALRRDALEGVLLLDGEGLVETGAQNLDLRVGLMLAQVDSRLKASEVKAVLLEVYPPHHPVQVVKGAGGPGERVETIPLEELDRAERFDHLTTIWVPPLQEAEIFDFRRLVDIVARLRGPGGCPWDRRQTHESLARHMVEEAHEAVDAIGHRDWDHLCEELGDLLLQVVLHARLGEEEGTFDIGDVLRLIIEKLVRRHPHVFGEAEARTPEEVISRWERIKAEERGEPSLLEGISEGLPALIHAYKLQSRAARVGFDWGAGEEVLPKLREELREVEEALREGEGDLEEELGDLLFTVVNMCRHFRVDPEIALRRSARKFAARFRAMEEECRRRGRPLEDMSLEELDSLWEESK